MTSPGYTTTIEVDQSPADVFSCITEVSKWWSKDYEGRSAALNDEFIIHHPGAHYSKQRLVEVVPNRRIVWRVTDSELVWLRDPSEWTNTTMVFDITGHADGTVLRFAHEGLVPDKQCYARCVEGWNTVIGEWLLTFITTGKTI